MFSINIAAFSNLLQSIKFPQNCSRNQIYLISSSSDDLLKQKNWKILKKKIILEKNEAINKNMSCLLTMILLKNLEWSFINR